MPKERKPDSQTQPGGTEFHRRKRVWFRTGRPSGLGSGSASAIEKRVNDEARVNGETPLLTSRDTNGAVIIKGGVKVTIDCVVTVKFSQPKTGRKQAVQEWTTTIRLSNRNPGLYEHQATEDDDTTNIGIHTELGTALLGQRVSKVVMVRENDYFPDSWPAWIRSRGWVCAKVVRISNAAAQQNLP